VFEWVRQCEESPDSHEGGTREARAVLSGAPDLVSSVIYPLKEYHTRQKRVNWMLSEAPPLKYGTTSVFTTS